VVVVVVVVVVVMMMMMMMMMIPQRHVVAAIMFPYMWCGYEVVGTILLRDLIGAMRLFLRKDISVYVSTCTSYDFKALTPVVWKLWC
jgi:hypothetical protein